MGMSFLPSTEQGNRLGVGAIAGQRFNVATVAIEQRQRKVVSTGVQPHALIRAESVLARFAFVGGKGCPEQRVCSDLVLTPADRSAELPCGEDQRVAVPQVEAPPFATVENAGRFQRERVGGT